MSSSQISGFTLIEMMMAMLVMTVGLLGLLQSTITAYEHSTRTFVRDESIRVAEEQLNAMKLHVSGPFNDQTTVTREIRGARWKFNVDRDAQPIGESLKITVKVEMQGMERYKGSGSHEVYTLKRNN